MGPWTRSCNPEGSLDESGGVSQISLGARHSCALMSSGSVHCWGYNGGSYANILGSPAYKGAARTNPKRSTSRGRSAWLPRTGAAAPWKG